MGRRGKYFPSKLIKVRVYATYIFTKRVGISKFQIPSLPGILWQFIPNFCKGEFLTFENFNVWNSHVKDSTWLAVGPVIGFFVIFGFIGSLWVWRLKRANNELRNLTCSEIRDFREGNSNSDPNNPLASIYGLPYDQKKEISRHEFELGTSDRFFKYHPLLFLLSL